MRFKLSFLVVCFFCQSIICQQTKIDSLRNIINTSSIDTLRYEAGAKLFMLQFRQNLDSARVSGAKMLEIAKNLKDKKRESEALRFIGNSYAVQANYPLALDYFLRSHNILIDIKDRKGISTTYNNIGLIYYEQGNYPEALRNMLKGLKISEELKDSVGIGRVTNNLGNVYLRQDDYNKALQYYLYSLEIKEKANNKRALILGYNNVGLTYTNLKKHDLALENLKKSAKLSEEVNDKFGLSRAYGNLGVENTSVGDYKNALYYLDKSIKIDKEINNKHGLATAQVQRALVYLNTKAYNSAINDAVNSLNLAKELGALSIQKEATLNLFRAYEKLGNSRLALKYYKQHVGLKDSIFNDEKANEIARQEIQYEFDKRQLADSIAYHKERAEQELLFERNLDKQRNKLNFVIFGVLALLIVGGVYWRSRQKGLKLERERKLVNRLKQVDQLKDQFLANTSHELRTPLNGIIGLAESLKDGVAGELPLKALENLDMISSSGKRLSHLVNDVLDFSKIKNHDLNLSISPVDLFSIADVILKLSQPLTKGKKISLINQISKNVPLIDADENRLQQILHNLIGNAIKFTEEGSVHVSAIKENDNLKISVKDTGIGIAKDKQVSIFKLFEQADGSIEREFGGTGLGLAISKQLIESQKGSIFVKSELGKGATFTFYLPLSKTLRKDFEEHDNYNENNENSVAIPKVVKLDKSDEGIIATRGFNRKNNHILIIDDEVINRMVLVNHLNVAGYNTSEAGNGREALSLIKKEKFDAILLDIMMPGMSGYEVCSEIRKEYSASELPVILLTAKNRVSDLVNGFNVGANDYLTKPFAKNELLSRIETHLNLKLIHDSSRRFVPLEFIKAVGKNTIIDVNLGDYTEKKVTVLFTDIRNYTTLSESMTPEENFEFVNAYVGKMGPIISQNNGFVNQYLGDGIMALFPYKAEDALKAAIEMQQRISEYNTNRLNKGFIPIEVGMGMHTGPLVMGIIGDYKRNDTAIIADTVNTASRMEGLTKYYGAKIILSGASCKMLHNKETFGLRYLGNTKVKGKQNDIDVFECFDGDLTEDVILKSSTLKYFNHGLKYFQLENYSKASEEFNKVLNSNANDKVVKYFIIKSAEYTISNLNK